MVLYLEKPVAQIWSRSVMKTSVGPGEIEVIFVFFYWKAG